MKALVLEGGGGRGAYQAGAIKALRKKGINFDAAGGTSIGAINAAFYVTHNFDAMYKLWTSTSSSYLFGIDGNVMDDLYFGKITMDDMKTGFRNIIDIIKSKGIDTKNMKKILDKHLNENRFMRSKVDFGLFTYNLSDMKPVMIRKADIPKGKLSECVLASAYLPFFKREKIINNKYYVDGGVYENCPVDMFADAGYEEIYVIKNWRSKLKYKNRKGVRVHTIIPREDLGSIMHFTKKASEYRINLGYYDTLKFLDNLDGNKYYFKYYPEEYFKTIFDKGVYKQMVKKYDKGFAPKNEKEFVLQILEKICEDLGVERFKVYNIPYLVAKLKFMIAGDKKNKYFDIIDKMKIEF